MIILDKRITVLSAVIVALSIAAFAYVSGSRGKSANLDLNSTAFSGHDSGDINWLIPENEIASVKASAFHGDNQAASRLANHFRELGHAVEARRWLEMVATRGDCASMAELKEFAESNHDRSAAAHWNRQLRLNACTWAKAYPQASRAINGSSGDMPLWNEQ